MWLMTAFGISALVLAAIGVYGLMAYAVEQRAHENLPSSGLTIPQAD